MVWRRTTIRLAAGMAIIMLLVGCAATGGSPGQAAEPTMSPGVATPSTAAASSSKAAASLMPAATSPMPTPPPGGVVMVNLKNLTGAAGTRLAGFMTETWPAGPSHIVYGGFSVEVGTDPYAGSELVRTGPPRFEPRWPTFGDDAARVAGGTVMLVIWVSKHLSGYSEVFPDNSADLRGCQIEVAVVPDGTEVFLDLVNLAKLADADPRGYFPRRCTLAPTVERSFPTGNWMFGNSESPAVMEFRPDYTITYDGTFTYAVGGQEMAEGTYAMSSGLFTIKTDTWCKDVEGGAEPATYSWTHVGDQLTLTKLIDPCASRAGMLDGVVMRPAE